MRFFPHLPISDRELAILNALFPEPKIVPGQTHRIVRGDDGLPRVEKIPDEERPASAREVVLDFTQEVFQHTVRVNGATSITIGETRRQRGNIRIDFIDEGSLTIRSKTTPVLWVLTQPARRFEKLTSYDVSLDFSLRNSACDPFICSIERNDEATERLRQKEGRTYGGGGAGGPGVTVNWKADPVVAFAGGVREPGGGVYDGVGYGGVGPTSGGTRIMGVPRSHPDRQTPANQESGEMDLKECDGQIGHRQSLNMVGSPEPALNQIHRAMEQARQLADKVQALHEKCFGPPSSGEAVNSQPEPAGILNKASLHARSTEMAVRSASASLEEIAAAMGIGRSKVKSSTD